MVLQLGSVTIERIAVVDDDERVRAGYGYSIVDLGLQVVAEPGPLPGPDELLRSLRGRVEAAICDHHLTMHNYATYNGAELVSHCYRERMPALLCTKWDEAGLDEIRPYRRDIPVLLNPAELEPETIVRGLTRCVNEFGGVYEVSRKEWRTVVRFEDVTTDSSHRFVFLIVSGWDGNEVVRLRLDSLPQEVQRLAKPGFRCHARVNIGADHASELYFTGWER